MSRISGKSNLAEAIRYGLTRKKEFERFLEDGRIEIDNNSVERAIRPQTITRKNALFAGSEAGGHTWATIASLLATARLNDVDPPGLRKPSNASLRDGQTKISMRSCPGTSKLPDVARWTLTPQLSFPEIEALPPDAACSQYLPASGVSLAFLSSYLSTNTYY